MRQRKAKNLEAKLAECKSIISDAKDIGTSPFFDGKTGGLYLEIGCGKGQFIIKKAIDNPGNRYVGIEGQETVVLRAAEKAMALDSTPTNFKLVCCFVHNVKDLFGENSLEGIYLNFSDPWPKARHAKRRLTYHKRLADYANAVKAGGFIEFKTDNDDLFEFTIEEMKMVPALEQIELTRDLHSEGCSFESRNTKTEYEEKFSGRGKNINYVKVLIKK